MLLNYVFIYLLVDNFKGTWNLPLGILTEIDNFNCVLFRIPYFVFCMYLTHWVQMELRWGLWDGGWQCISTWWFWGFSRISGLSNALSVHKIVHLRWYTKKAFGWRLRRKKCASNYIYYFFNNISSESV